MSVPKRRQHRAETELRAVADIANRLAHRWDTYMAVEAALNPPTMRAATADGSRSHDHADPTPHAAHHPDYDDVREAVTGLLHQARWIQQKMHNSLSHHPDYATNRERDRCSGAIDPTCTENWAVRKGKYAGLCMKCISRKRRIEARQDAEQPE